MRMSKEQEQCLKGVAEPMGRFVPQDLLMAADGGVTSIIPLDEGCAFYSQTHSSFMNVHQ